MVSGPSGAYIFFCSEVYFTFNHYIQRLGKYKNIVDYRWEHTFSMIHILYSYKESCPDKCWVSGGRISALGNKTNKVARFQEMTLKPKKQKTSFEMEKMFSPQSFVFLLFLEFFVFFWFPSRGCVVFWFQAFKNQKTKLWGETIFSLSKDVFCFFVSVLFLEIWQLCLFCYQEPTRWESCLQWQCLDSRIECSGKWCSDRIVTDGRGSLDRWIWQRVGWCSLLSNDFLHVCICYILIICVVVNKILINLYCLKM